MGCRTMFVFGAGAQANGTGACLTSMIDDARSESCCQTMLSKRLRPTVESDVCNSFDTHCDFRTTNDPTINTVLPNPSKRYSTLRGTSYIKAKAITGLTAPPSPVKASLATGSSRTFSALSHSGSKDGDDSRQGKSPRRFRFVMLTAG